MAWVCKGGLGINIGCKRLPISVSALQVRQGVVEFLISGGEVSYSKRSCLIEFRLAVCRGGFTGIDNPFFLTQRSEIYKRGF